MSGVISTTALEAQLTALDRCDRCRAQAVRVTSHRRGLSTLLWCDHHYRVHYDALKADYDYRQRTEGVLLGSSPSEILRENGWA